MSIKLNELIADPSLWKRLRESRDIKNRCIYCKVILQEMITEIHSTSNGLACGDCYYEQLGTLVEF